MEKYESIDENELDGFSYSGEDFFGLDFSHGTYKNGRFYKCNFRGCPFRKSTFTNAVFDECNLEGVDFSGSTFMECAIRENCTVNRETDFTASFDVSSFNSSYEAICKRVTV